MCFLSGGAVIFWFTIFGDIFDILHLSADQVLDIVRNKAFQIAISAVVFFKKNFFSLNFPGMLLIGRLSEHCLYCIRIRFINSMIRKPISFFDKHSPSEIVNRLGDDVSTIHKGLGDKPSKIAFFLVNLLWALCWHLLSLGELR
ncbi:hypothetical protein GEMRC1_003353 [Eukaryota sp. GEM-RC1]